jgi:enoyl-CoA hydratase/carnithine racemase
VQNHVWDATDDPVTKVAVLAAEASREGYLIVEFNHVEGDGSGLDWGLVEPWTRSRAITIAVVAGRVASPALGVALCSDLVYLLPSSRLMLAFEREIPTPATIWALGRAGRKALARGLLDTGDLEPQEAVDLGLAHRVLGDRAELPLSEDDSLVAATIARDLMRSEVPGRAGLALELAAFRLIFASGHPERGAAAFLEKKPPEF